MYRVRFLFPGRRRITEFLCGGFFFYEGAHLGFLQFGERQLFFFFPSFIREKKRSLSSKIPTARRKEEKSEKKERTKHTQRERRREKEVRACV